MRTLAKVLLMLVIALVLGIGSALGDLHLPVARLGLSNGAWRTNLAVGSPAAGMYLRAYIARVGLFALNKTETIYYTAETDDDGRPLRSRCDYRIEGRDLPARWWSLTLYGEDNFLIPNNNNRWSYGQKSVARPADGGYVIMVSANPRDGDWLPAGDKDQGLALSLRLYNPEAVVYESPETIALPRIVREACP